MPLARGKSAFLLGAFLFVLVLSGAQVSRAQTDSISWDRPLIAIVWPGLYDKEGRPIKPPFSEAVNVSIWPTLQVPCANPLFRPNQLYVARDNEPGYFVTAPQIILRTVHGVTFPSQEFNNVAADLMAHPDTKYSFALIGWSNVWVHGADPRTIYPQPVAPTGQFTGHSVIPLDVRIQVVWPHDDSGQYASADRATFVNIGVDIFEHGTLISAPLDYISPSYEIYGPFLSVAQDNQPLRDIDPGTGQHIWPQAVQTSYRVNGQPFPRWVFNNVPVQPGHQYHFLALVGFRRAIPPMYPTIWTHAADARTNLPTPSVPPPCVP